VCVAGPLCGAAVRETNEALGPAVVPARVCMLALADALAERTRRLQRTPPALARAPSRETHPTDSDELHSLLHRALRGVPAYECAWTNDFSPACWLAIMRYRYVGPIGVFITEKSDNPGAMICQRPD